MQIEENIENLKKIEQIQNSLRKDFHQSIELYLDNSGREFELSCNCKVDTKEILKMAIDKLNAEFGVELTVDIAVNGGTIISGTCLKDSTNSTTTYHLFEKTAK